MICKYASYFSRPPQSLNSDGLCITCDNTTISWRLVKQLMATTSSNHLEIFVIHEVSHKYAWLKSMIQHIRELCGLFFIQGDLTILFEDNATCIVDILFKTNPPLNQAQFILNNKNHSLIGQERTCFNLFFFFKGLIVGV